MDKEKIFEVVTKRICDVITGLEDHVFKYDDRLEDLGANSVDRADIILLTMESLSIQAPRVELTGAQNLGELVEIIHEKLN